LFKRMNCRRRSGLGPFGLSEFDAVSAIVLGAVERGIAPRQQRFNRNRRKRS
jgi:hypothetical protein